MVTIMLLRLILPLIIITYSGYSLSYQMYDFSDNYVEKLKQRESEYKKYDTELNNRYKTIKNKLSAYELGEEFKKLSTRMDKLQDSSLFCRRVFP